MRHYYTASALILARKRGGKVLQHVQVYCFTLMPSGVVEGESAEKEKSKPDRSSLMAG